MIYFITGLGWVRLLGGGVYLKRELWSILVIFSHLVNERFVFSPEIHLEATDGVLARVESHHSPGPSQLPEGDFVLEVSLSDVARLGVVEVWAAGHGVSIIEITAHLEVAGVLIEGIIVEAHLTGDNDRHFDIEGDPLGAGDPQAGHLTEDVVLLELLQAVDLQVGFPEELQSLRVLSAHVDGTSRKCGYISNLHCWKTSLWKKKTSVQRKPAVWCNFR